MRRACNQTAVYWASPTDDGYGNFVYADPVEISVRWEDSTEVITDSKGQERVSKAEVIVLQDVVEQGLLFLGDIADLDSTEEDDPTTIDGAYPVVRFDKTPGIKGRSFLRKAWL